MARPAACLLAVLLGTTGGSARAATVVVVRADGGAGPRWGLAEQRVRDELRALGMTVADARPSSLDDGAMAALLAEHAAVAAVHITRASDRAEVTLWLAEPAPRRIALTLEGSQPAAIAALHTAELVYGESRSATPPRPVADADAAPPAPLVSWDPAASTSPPPAIPAPPRPAPAMSTEPSPQSLVPPLPAAAEAPRPSSRPPISQPELAAPPAPTRPPQPSEFDDELPPLVRAAPAPAGRQGLLVAVDVGGGPGGAGVLVGPELAARRELTSRLEFGGGLFSLLSPTWMAGPRGSIRLGLVAARVQLGLRWQLAPRLSLRLALGGGIALGWAVGRALEPWRSATSFAPVGLLSPAITFVIPFARRASLHAGFAADILLPAMRIHSAGLETARLGLPLLRGVLGIAWDWSLRRP
ncbi:hypothetical protein [Nannocystis bainbridge]|uniref:Uncharacterized protein n=1 Tax=Nannocystis bainbridge TaxID=2995303 RepID=A0ABT5EEZ7_9BACT|nr:hypothetical protein [Nannocystis bainbridge]MDC0723513.1 hypothetical protein [Nannocystis bainbridge]